MSNPISRQQVRLKLMTRDLTQARQTVKSLLDASFRQESELNRKADKVKELNAELRLAREEIRNLQKDLEHAVSSLKNAAGSSVKKAKAPKAKSAPKAAEEADDN